MKSVNQDNPLAHASWILPLVVALTGCASSPSRQNVQAEESNRSEVRLDGELSGLKPGDRVKLTRNECASPKLLQTSPSPLECANVPVGNGSVTDVSGGKTTVVYDEKSTERLQAERSY